MALVLAAKRPDINISQLPEIFQDYGGRIYADDIWDAKVPDAKAASHAKTGFEDGQGGVVVVRPDGHVGCAVKLVEGSGTVDALQAYFDSFMVKKEEGSAQVETKPMPRKDGSGGGQHVIRAQL